jgi:hypothetical protein
LSGQRLHVGADLVFFSGFVTEGPVLLSNSEIGGNVLFAEGEIASDAGPALNGSRMAVKQSILLSRDLTVRGDVLITHAQIAGDLDMNRLNLATSRVALNGTHVGGRLAWRPGSFAGHLDLRGASARELDDDLPAWGEGSYSLAGLQYESFATRWPLESRLSWLERSEDGYSPQAYDQLATVYRAAGEGDAARRILIRKQRFRAATRREGRLVGRQGLRANLLAKIYNRIDLAIDWFLRTTTGYGFSPLMILPWLGALWLAASVVFSLLHPELVRARGVPPADFHSTLFALDLLLPVANLGQRSLFILEGWAVWLGTLFTLAGWILGVVLLAGLAGLFRRD